jgi:hypothetical protein
MTGWLIIIISLPIFGCQIKEHTGVCFDYPKQIDSLQIQDLYDTARLYVYTWRCDKKYGKYYRGQFELTYKSFFKRNDSIEIFFTQYLPKELQDSTDDDNIIYRTSIAFNLKTKRKLWGWDINEFSASLNPGDARFESCATPEVLNFISKHKQILNPCFLELAKKSKLVVD